MASANGTSTVPCSGRINCAHQKLRGVMMASVNVRIGNVGSYWPAACKQAVKDLNALFKQKGIKVTLALGGTGPTIGVKTDAGITGTAVHGRTRAEVDGSGRLRRAEVSLPVKLTINTPSGSRDAGIGMAEVVAAHELVHALGHTPHDTHLMARTLQKVMGDRPAGDKLRAGAVAMPPLQLSKETVKALKDIWG